MAQQHRFSRRFLTILIFVTCVAIVLLSKMDDSEQSPAPAPSNSPELKQEQP